MLKQQQTEGNVVSASEGFAQWFRELMERKPLSPEESEKLRESAVAEMLAAAKQMEKGSWFSYRDCKQIIAHVLFTPEQYDAVIEQILDILEL